MMHRLRRVTKDDIRRWRDFAENCPDQHLGDILLALIRELEDLHDEIRRLRQERTG
jgi:hypothetical protein